MVKLTLNQLLQGEQQAAKDEVSGKNPHAIDDFNKKYGIHGDSSLWGKFWGSMASGPLAADQPVWQDMGGVANDLKDAGDDLKDLGDDTWGFLKWLWDHPWLALAIGVGGFIGVFLLIHWALGGTTVVPV